MSGIVSEKFRCGAGFSLNLSVNLSLNLGLNLLCIKCVKACIYRW